MTAQTLGTITTLVSFALAFAISHRFARHGGRTTQIVAILLGPAAIASGALGLLSVGMQSHPERSTDLVGPCVLAGGAGAIGCFVGGLAGAIWSAQRAKARGAQAQAQPEPRCPGCGRALGLEDHEKGCRHADAV